MGARCLALLAGIFVILSFAAGAGVGVVTPSVVRAQALCPPEDFDGIQDGDGCAETDIGVTVQKEEAYTVASGQPQTHTVTILVSNLGNFAADVRVTVLAVSSPTGCKVDFAPVTGDLFIAFQTDENNDGTPDTYFSQLEFVTPALAPGETRTTTRDYAVVCSQAGSFPDAFEVQVDVLPLGGVVEENLGDDPRVPPDSPSNNVNKNFPDLVVGNTTTPPAACPPEDFDGIQDGDGCAETDIGVTVQKEESFTVAPGESQSHTVSILVSNLGNFAADVRVTVLAVSSPTGCKVDFVAVPGDQAIAFVTDENNDGTPDTYFSQLEFVMPALAPGETRTTTRDYTVVCSLAGSFPDAFEIQVDVLPLGGVVEENLGDDPRVPPDSASNNVHKNFPDVVVEEPPPPGPCLGPGGGRTMGFWSNKNGRAVMNDGGTLAPELALLSGLHLRRANGSDFDPTSYPRFRSWLLSADASNMAYMLSAQLSAMVLNVEAGFVDGSALIWDGSAFVTVNSVIAAADAALAADGYTPSGDPNRALQEQLKSALDGANNDLNFLVPCP